MSNANDGAPLVARRTIRASPERLFAAWTLPEQLTAWWGPEGVDCTHAEVDLRIGGAYRIANRFPDGRVVWISGEFETVAPPHELAYTWRLDADAAPERVTVRFEARGSELTEVIIVHERIANDEMRRGHEMGWIGCLASLGTFIAD